MPRSLSPKNEKCVICSNNTQTKSNILCDTHYLKVLKKIEKLLDYYNSDFTALLSAFVDVGVKKNHSSYEEIKELIAKRLNITFCTQPTSTSKVNITQALKRFCRDKFKENPTKYGKPPKNSSSKQDFVLWANKNNIDLTHFKTRTYTKRTESNDDYIQSFSPNNSYDSSETDKCSSDDGCNNKDENEIKKIDSRLQSDFSVGSPINTKFYYPTIPFSEFQYPPYHEINLFFKGIPLLYPPNMYIKEYNPPQIISNGSVEHSVAHILSRIY